MDRKKKAAPTGNGKPKRLLKDNEFQNQRKIVYQSFFENPQTMKEVDKSTGIMRENICWHCRELRKQNLLFKTRKRLCKITKHRATEWTTNPNLVPTDIQLNLF